MEFADNYLMIGLLACIVVLIVFLIWYHTRKDAPVERFGVPMMKNPPPPTLPKDLENFLEELKIQDERRAELNELKMIKEQLDNSPSITIGPRKPVQKAPDQFRFHSEPPRHWTDKQYTRYLDIKRKYITALPDKGFGEKLDYFCMDCGYNNKFKNFLSYSCCPHCHSFRIKAVPYL